MRVPPLVCVFFGVVFLSPRVPGTCPVTTDFDYASQCEGVVVALPFPPSEASEEHGVVNPP